VEADPLLRRVGRTSVAVCLVMAAAAGAVSEDHWGAALAVLGGGLIAATSYLAIQSGVDAFADRLVSSGRSAIRRAAIRWTVMKVTGRYALLALIAYVMIARLRLPPWGLLAGASSVVAAVAIEAVRLFTNRQSGSRT
jgi:hypothetical protein